MAAGGLVIALCDSYPFVVAGRLVSGAGAILLNVLVTKMVADWFVERGIVTAMAILVTSWPLGIGLALVTLPFLAEAGSWQAGMLLTTMLSLVALGLVALIYRVPLPASGEGASVQSRGKFSGTALILILLAGLIWAFFNAAFAIIPGFAPGFLVAAGYTVVAASSMVSVVSWLLLLSLPVGGSVAERLRRPNFVLVACFTGAGFCTIMLALWSSPVPTLVALGLLFGPPAGIIAALPVEVVRPEDRGPGMGLFWTCYYALVPVLVALAGFSRDMTGSPAAPLFLGGLLVFAASLFLVLFRAVQRHVT